MLTSMTRLEEHPDSDCITSLFTLFIPEAIIIARHVHAVRPVRQLVHQSMPLSSHRIAIRYHTLTA